MRSPERVQQWQEILRRADIALEGRRVGAWQVDDQGRLELRAASAHTTTFVNGGSELQAVFSKFPRFRGARVPSRSYWVASRLDSGWCVAPVRPTTPTPPPGGIERRARERLVLEWAATSLGLVGTPDSAAAPIDADTQVNEILAASPVGISWISRDGTILRASDAEIAMLGFEPDEYIGQPISRFHMDAGVADLILRRLADRDPVRNVQATMRHRYGSVRDVLISANPVRERADGTYALLVTRDITDLHIADEELARYKAMVLNADDAIVGKTLDGVVTHWNPGAERLFGYSADEMIGQPISMIVPLEHQQELPAIFASLKRGDRIEHFETARIRKDGARVEVSISISPVFDVTGRVIGATAIKRDITARKEIEARLLRGALHDALTDLPNRVAFHEQLERSLARSQRDPDYRFAVLFMDCDEFKRVNDTLGHSAGDRLLQQISDRLKAVVRPNDVVARLGGDEFTVLLDDIAGRADVENAARRVLDAFELPFRLNGDEVSSAVSIGAVLCEAGCGSPEEILEDADTAMYHAKQAGGGQFHLFDAAMRASAQERSEVMTDLRGALERHEFRILYQPIVELETGHVFAVEALLRWEHPKRGVVAPLDFLPLAERAGIIVPIEEWVLGEACRNASNWRERHAESAQVPICVNVSRSWLATEGMAQNIERRLIESGLSPSSLVLDVAERTLTELGESAAECLGSLHNLSIGVFLDDFGTGYSSMNLMSQYPFLGVKVDHSVVHRMGIRRTDLQIMRSIVDVAHTLGLKLIAEGVDTLAQRERLIAIGCDLAQGTLLSAPLEGPDVERFFRKSGNGANSAVIA